MRRLSLYSIFWSVEGNLKQSTLILPRICNKIQDINENWLFVDISALNYLFLKNTL